MPITLACPCGNSVEVGESVCPACGQPVEAPPPSPVEIEAPPAANPEPMLGLTVVETVFISPTPLPAPPELAVVPQLSLDEPPAPTSAPVEEILTVVPAAPEVSEHLDFVNPNEKIRPLHPIYPALSIFLATLLGGLLAGCFVLAYNYQSLRRRKSARLMAALGILATLGFLAFIFAYPAAGPFFAPRIAAYVVFVPLWVIGSPQFSLGDKLAVLALPVVMYALARFLQAAFCAAFLREGGRRGPIAGAGGIGLTCSVAIFAGLCVNAAVFPPGRDVETHLLVCSNFRKEVKIYYEDNVPEQEVDRLGRLLLQWGPPDDSGNTTVWVRRNNEARILSFVVDEASWEDARLLGKMKTLRTLMAANVFGRRPLIVEFRDVELTATRKIP